MFTFGTMISPPAFHPLSNSGSVSSIDAKSRRFSRAFPSSSPLHPSGCFTATDLKRIDIIHMWKGSEGKQTYHCAAYKLQFCYRQCSKCCVPLNHLKNRFFFNVKFYIFGDFFIFIFSFSFSFW